METTETTRTATDITTATKVLPIGTLISTKFRTGNEVHAAKSNSTMTACNRYLKQIATFRRVFAPVTCELCLAKEAE